MRDNLLRRVLYSDGYTGWVYDLGDGTCRFANAPCLGSDGPRFGDRVEIVLPRECVTAGCGPGICMDDRHPMARVGTEILERYVPEIPTGGI
jgi:hypothetical protein